MCRVRFAVPSHNTNAPGALAKVATIASGALASFLMVADPTFSAVEPATMALLAPACSPAEVKQANSRSTLGQQRETLQPAMMAAPAVLFYDVLEGVAQVRCSSGQACMPRWMPGE